MSRASRYGYAARISSAVWPLASNPINVPTVTRSPRMQGFPPITAGSCVIRSTRFMCTIVTLGAIRHAIAGHDQGDQTLDRDALLSSRIGGRLHSPAQSDG